jgi:transitional endoplasmic reticulum ATPase
VIPLIIAILVVGAFIGAVWALFAAIRRANQVRRQMQQAATTQGGMGSGANPFAGLPFGSMLDDMMSSANMSVSMRSLAFDSKTGEWVDITDQSSMMKPGEDATPTPAVPATKPKTRTRPAAMSNPLSGLLSGLDGSGQFEVEPPEELGSFKDVGGMESLKQEVRDTVGLMLQHPDDADRYGIEWNGILLHGPPGVGKTFFARAIAGEYRMNLMHISTGDLVSGIQGGSARNIESAFAMAAQNLPCLLFFDEFDSVAQRRDNTPDQEGRRTVNQLLTSLEAYRDERLLLVMAATNSVEHLDPAVVRAGRFDRHIRIDLPDAEARKAIFRAELEDRPADPGVDLDELVQRTEGMTPAAISKIVETAALDVFRRATQAGQEIKVTTQDLLAAAERYGGQDRPTVEHWSWDSLILAPEIKQQLQQLQAVIEDPEAAQRFGVDPPTGLLLAGPPGTGKTTVAKVLAAQARCSFYPVSGADVMSKWVGESERNISQLFDRARENKPSIIFIDEIDAIAGRRGEVETRDSQVNQLLTEMDGISGQQGVFIIGATNRPDQLDPALLRGGRLSRTIILGLPDEAGRLAMLRLHSARMPTVGVRLEELARDTEGSSPADLKALCQEAGLAAMARASRVSGGGEQASAQPTITHEDFVEARGRLAKT